MLRYGFWHALNTFRRVALTVGSGSLLISSYFYQFCIALTNIHCLYYILLPSIVLASSTDPALLLWAAKWPKRSKKDDGSIGDSAVERPAPGETSGNIWKLQRSWEQKYRACKAQTCADIHKTERRMLRIWDVRVEKFLERIKRTGMTALLHGSCQQTKVLLFWCGFEHPPLQDNFPVEFYVDIGSKHSFVRFIDYVKLRKVVNLEARNGKDHLLLPMLSRANPELQFACHLNPS